MVLSHGLFKLVISRKAKDHRNWIPASSFVFSSEKRRVGTAGLDVYIFPFTINSECDRLPTTFEFGISRLSIHHEVGKVPGL